MKGVNRLARPTSQRMQRSLLKDLKVLERMLPKNWHLIDENNALHPDLYRGKWIPKTRNTLFIPVYFINGTPEEDPLRMGESHGPMRFDDGFAVKELFIYPHKKEHSEMRHTMIGTIIHELAHIAVDRLLAWRLRKTQPLINSAADFGENQHGATFQRALKVFIERMASVYGDELGRVIEEMSEDLSYFEFVSDE